MSISRFYQPSFSQYQSQYVPDKLPVDLMVAALGNKQKAEDAARDNTNKLGLWDKPALPGMDTYVRDQYKKGIEQFIDESFGLEQSSPEFQRRYINKVRDIRDNPELKKIESAYNTHQAYLKTIEDYKKDPNTYSYAIELEHEYNQRYANYTKPVESGGMGYKGDVGLGDANILRGTDINKEGEELFNHIKDSGSESLKFLEAGLAYKNGWSGVDKTTIDNQTARMLDQWVSSPAGRQLGHRFDMREFPNEAPSVAISKMTPEQQTEYINKRNTYIGNELLKIGRGFQHGQSTTNADVAYRDRWGVGQARMDANPSDPNLHVAGDTAPFTRDYDKDNATRVNIAANLKDINRALDDIPKAIQWFKDGHKTGENPIYDKLIQAANSPATIDKWKATKYALEQRQKELDAVLQNARVAGFVANNPIIKPEFVNELNEFKLKFAPYGSKNSYVSQELSAIDADFTEKYELAKQVFIKNGFQNINEMGAVQDLANLYEQGNAEIAKIRNALGDKMTPEDKAQLDFYEQKFNINITNIFSKIPEKYLTTVKTSGRPTDHRFAHLPWQGQTITTTFRFGKETFENAVKQKYNEESSWSPMAVARGTTDYTTLVNPDGSLQPKSVRAVKQLEDIVSGNPTNHIVMIGNKVIEPGEQGYPIPGTVKIVSTNISKFGNDPTPILSVQYDTWGTKKVPVYGTDKVSIIGYKDEMVKIPANGTIIAKGVAATQFNNRYAQEMQSDIIKNPTDPQNVFRYADIVQLNDPKLASDLTEIAKLNKGEAANLELGTRKETGLSLQVRRNSVNDSWTIKVTDPNELTSKPVEITLPDIAAVQAYYEEIYRDPNIK